MGTGFTRRRFLSTLGAGAFLALTSGCGLPGRAQKLRSSRIPKASPLRAPKVWPLPGVSPVLPKGVWAFRSRPDLAPAAAEVTGRTSGTAPSYVFLALKEGAGEHGPMILDDRGQLVWFEKYITARAFKVQRYRGRPVLTWWEGSIVFGHGVGEYVIFDDSYREIARVRAGNGFRGTCTSFSSPPRTPRFSPPTRRCRRIYPPQAAGSTAWRGKGYSRRLISRPAKYSSSGTAWSTSESMSRTSCRPKTPPTSTTTSTSTP